MLKLLSKLSLSVIFFSSAFSHLGFSQDHIVDDLHFTLHDRNLSYKFQDHTQSKSYKWLLKKGVQTFTFSQERDLNANLPTSADLSSFCPDVYDQGQLGSCTANAIGAAMETSQIREKQSSHFTPSRLFIYYNERVIEGTVLQDAGAMISDGLKTVSKQGACPETQWTYSDGKAKFRVKPPKKCYKSALNTVVLDQVTALAPDLETLKTVLSQNIPFVFGIQVYSSMMTNDVAKSGVVPMPTASDSIAGGHALLMVGYDDAKQAFKFRNSWSNQWGQKGYGWIPYEYITNPNLSQEFFAIDKVGVSQQKPHQVHIPILSNALDKVQSTLGTIVNEIIQ